MNIFVLTTGRTGSTTFIQACKHITNYSASHESRCEKVGSDRFDYPINHIEADNRLVWFLGRLDRAYGNNAFYVHLKRSRQAVAESYAKRSQFEWSIIYSYKRGILMGASENISELDVSLDYYDTVNANIEYFLKNKTNKMVFTLENAKDDFRLFWESIRAEGNISSALKQWDTTYNKTITSYPVNEYSRPFLFRIAAKLFRIIRSLPRYLRDA